MSVDEASACASLGTDISWFSSPNACSNHLSGLIKHIDRLGQAKGYWDVPYLDGKLMPDFYIFGVEVFIPLVLNTKERYIVGK